LRSVSLSSADRSELMFINCDADWKQLISTVAGSKLTLRIQDHN
jgi:hypothetical protein